MDKTEEVKLIQEVELGILREFLRVVNQHQLTYYVIGGTLLGAVRHGGFIPWDDDIDIAMPREDYEYLVNHCQADFQLPYRLIDNRSQPDFNKEFLNIQDSSTRIQFTYGKKKVISSIWLDIFPIDGMPASGIKRKYHEKSYLFHRMMAQLANFESEVNLNKVNRPLLEKAIIQLAVSTNIERWLKADYWQKAYYNTLTKYDMSEEYSGTLTGIYKLGELVPTRLWGRGRRINFAGVQVNAPEHHLEYLQTIYGDDYMTVPPEEKRVYHQFDVLSFGDNQ